jgi:RNA polymerase sigma-70 factor, ECF subfamily
MDESWQQDGVLADAAARGDGAAFARLVQRHHQRVHAHGWRILGEASRAEDIAQEVFLKLWTGKARYDASRGALLPWLLRITTNACLDARRALKPVVELTEAHGVADDRPDAHANAEAKALHAILATLPQRQRAAIALFYLEGFSMKEVAEVLGTNSKAVEGLLSRGKAALKHLLGEGLPETQAYQDRDDHEPR